MNSGLSPAPVPGRDSGRTGRWSSDLNSLFMNDTSSDPTEDTAVFVSSHDFEPEFRTMPKKRQRNNQRMFAAIAEYIFMKKDYSVAMAYYAIRKKFPHNGGWFNRDEAVKLLSKSMARSTAYRLIRELSTRGWVVGSGRRIKFVSERTVYQMVAAGRTARSSFRIGFKEVSSVEQFTAFVAGAVHAYGFKVSFKATRDITVTDRKDGSRVKLRNRHKGTVGVKERKVNQGDAACKYLHIKYGVSIGYAHRHRLLAEKYGYIKVKKRYSKTFDSYNIQRAHDLQMYVEALGKEEVTVGRFQYSSKLKRFRCEIPSLIISKLKAKNKLIFLKKRRSYIGSAKAVA